MTIAACYVCSDGVVFGSDSTWSVPVPVADGESESSTRYFAYGQKILEIGEGSTLGIVIWGLVLLKDLSFRTLVARLADDLQQKPATSMEEVASRCTDLFRREYESIYHDERQEASKLQQITQRNKDDDERFLDLKEAYRGGFCIGGHVLTDRVPKAFEIGYDVTMPAPKGPTPLSLGSLKMWGSPNLMSRILVGVDVKLLKAIAESGKWQGTLEDLFDIVRTESSLAQPANLPIREAVDWVHATLETTVKVTKFTHLPPICGGPIDLAIITTDRPFRWVRRKKLSAAIQQLSRES